MSTIYKYPIPHSANEFGEFSIEIRGFRKVLHVGMQGSSAFMWCEVDTALPNVTVDFAIVGTGGEVPWGWRYVATWFEGSFVWHLYTTA